MKTTIYYFSGTGNSLKIAESLADKLGNTDLISISSIIKENKKSKLLSKRCNSIWKKYFR